jgi:predicted PurR-regulated permease PerM
LESLTQSIHYPLQLLIYASVFFIIIIGVFLIKLLIDLSGLVKSLQDFVQATQKELEPTISEIKATLVNINKISLNVSSQINNMNVGIKKGAKAVLGASAIIGSRAKDVGKIIGKNLLSGFYLLMSSRK